MRIFLPRILGRFWAAPLCVAVMWLLAADAVAQRFPWKAAASADSVEQRFLPPAGYTRIKVGPGSFGAWLRQLPLLPGRPSVLLFNGRPKINQEAHVAILDIDVGTRDLQQCADAVMRLRAEYLRAVERPEQICFRLTDGTKATWSQWAKGYRGQVKGNRIQFQRTAAANNTYAAFRSYLNFVFAYAGSMSLHKELQPVAATLEIEPGDVFIKGGFPGHAVIVLDVAEAADGKRAFLLAQSYMPAQQIHVLAKPGQASPWYKDDRSAPLVTPEWMFPRGALHRFAAEQCAAGASP